ncbi:hypothetical protein BC629DRAFT_1530603 [Irpex lacteus]|nr:hypothetical protein BC629DRAFT_1530603 [Irpex lacteus]
MSDDSNTVASAATRHNPPGPGMVTATHVCTHLRHVALATPKLWATLTLVESSTRWLPNILRRSGTHPLSLSCHDVRKSHWDSEFDDREIAGAVLSQPQHLSRVQSASIFDLHGWQLFASALLTQPAPQLEQLFLGPDRLQELTGKEQGHVVVLPSPLFGAKLPLAPRLTRLSLKKCDFLWSSLQHFSSLTVLSIERPNILPHDEYSVKYVAPPGNKSTEIITYLRAMPRLEKLSLANALPNTDPPAGEFPRIPLPNLRALSLTQQNLHPAALILDLLDAPRLLTPTPATHRPRSHRTLARFLSTFASNLPEPITTLILSFGHDRTYPYDRTHSSSPSPCLDIGITTSPPPTTPATFPTRHTIIEPILSALPLSHLHHLDMKDTTSPTSPTSYHHAVDFPLWTRLFSLCSNVSRITAKHLALVPLIPLLATRNNPKWTFTKPPDHHRTPAFPHLQHLDLYIQDFGDTDYGVRVCLLHRPTTEDQPRLSMEHIVSSYFNVVRDTLASRAHYALPTHDGRSPAASVDGPPKLKTLSMTLKMWGTDVSRAAVARFEDTFVDKFAGVAEVVQPLDLHVIPRLMYRTTAFSST